MGLALGLEKGQCTQADLAAAVKMVPKALEPYITGYALTYLLTAQLIDSLVVLYRC